jgi:hypothetical protein
MINKLKKISILAFAVLLGQARSYCNSVTLNPMSTTNYNFYANTGVQTVTLSSNTNDCPTGEWPIPYIHAYAWPGCWAFDYDFYWNGSELVKNYS